MKHKRYYLHIMHDSVYTIQFILFLNKNFDKNEHFVFIRGLVKELSKYTEEKNVFILKKRQNKIINIPFYIYSYCNLFIKMVLYKKMIFHGLFDPLIILILFCNKILLKKSLWAIWGGDLYEYQERNLKQHYWIKLYLGIADYVRKSFTGYLSLVEGDYKLAQKWFGAKGRYFKCNLYPMKFVESVVEKEKNTINIQIGNSADSSNNHIEILDKLKPFKGENVLINCPLSYGDSEWAKYVSQYGRDIFGEKFISLTSMMPYEQYMQWLSNIDIAVFAHNRQQGLGNIVVLLGLGKTVYLKKNVTTYYMLRDLGISVFPFEEFDNLNTLTVQEKKNNIKIVKSRFSEEKLINDWKCIFDKKRVWT
jgi:hypothetical protein